MNPSKAPAKTMMASNDDEGRHVGKDLWKKKMLLRKMKQSVPPGEMMLEMVTRPYMGRALNC